MTLHNTHQSNSPEPTQLKQTVLPAISKDSAISLHQPSQSTTCYPNTSPSKTLNMHHSHAKTTRSAAPRRSFMSRFSRTPRRNVRTTTTTTRTAQTYVGTAPAQQHHHKRKVTLGDKISGAMLKLKGSLTRRPAVKAAGTRRMHGTDGRGSRHVY